METIGKKRKLVIYEEGGKGRKKCPECSSFIPSLSHICPSCDYKFPGVSPPGQKECPNCHEYVGRRSGVCKHCGHELIAGFKQKLADKEKEKEARRKNCPNCEEYVPINAGVCKDCGHELIAGFKQRQAEQAKRTIKTYKESGVGRKHCPACEIYVSAKTQTCVCGHKFVKVNSKELLDKILSGEITEAEAKQQIQKVKVKVYDAGGSRRKECPKCNKFVGYSSDFCACGFKFEKILEKKKKGNVPFSAPIMVDIESSRFQRAMGTQSMLVFAPSGLCPCKLTGIDYNQVKAWTEKVVEAGEQLDKCYSPAALRYFAREFGTLIDFDVFSEKYKTICNHITQWSQELCEGY